MELTVPINVVIDDEKMQNMIEKVLDDNDVVQVVRCRDCKSFLSEEGCCRGWAAMVKPDDYCSYGVRKENNDE